MIDVRRDLAGLKIAADELYEESFRAKELEQILSAMPIDQVQPHQVLEAVRNLMPQRTVARGYHTWALYLMWLWQISELTGTDLQLRADEAEGILVIRAAENRFRATHPPCWQCGALNIKDAGCCRECMADFKD